MICWTSSPNHRNKRNLNYILRKYFFEYFLQHAEEILEYNFCQQDRSLASILCAMLISILIGLKHAGSGNQQINSTVHSTQRAFYHEHELCRSIASFCRHSPDRPCFFTTSHVFLHLPRQKSHFVTSLDFFPS